MRRFRILLVALLAGPVAVLTASASPASSATVCAGLNTTMVGTGGDDVLNGTPGRDVIAGLAGDDTIRGGGGDDVICAGFGTDRLAGDAGNDRLYGERNGLRPSPDGPDNTVGDILEGGPGNDLLDPGYDTTTDKGGGFLPDTISYRGSAAGVRVDLEVGSAAGDGTDTLVLEGAVDLVGSEHDDLLLGSALGDSITSLGGDDVVDGRAGADSLVDDVDRDSGVDGGQDTFLGGPGGDYLTPGTGDDVTRGGGGLDQIEDDAGRPDIFAGPGDDQISATLALDRTDNRIVGGAGSDHLILGVGRGPRVPLDARGRVDLAVGTMRTRIGGRTGAGELRRVESLVLPEGRWRVRGSRRGELVFAGFLGTSRLAARMGGGNDRVNGSPGPDLIIGGAGQDRARPGRGRDVCRSIERQPADDACEVRR
ncbi:MAG: calcium-binding protein [Nocardioides sp.]